MRTTTALFILACAAAAAAHPGPAAAHGNHCRDLTPFRLDVLAHDRLHSTLALVLGYERGFEPLLADDVVLLEPGQPVLQGRAAARAYFAGRDPSERLRWTPTRIDASGDGTLGTSWGWTLTTARAADGTTTTTNGRNMVVWKRTSRGWRVAVYVQGASAPPQPTPAGFGLFPDERRRCTTPVDPIAEAGVIADTDAAFAALSVAAGAGPAFGAFAAPDAVLRGGGQLFIGPEAIEALFGDTPPDVEVLDWAPVFAVAAGSGDLGWTVGTATDTVFDPAGDQVFYSKYLTLWQKQPDGAWRYVADGGNTMPAP
jgi:ketosteroid isomerase-like protein